MIVHRLEPAQWAELAPHASLISFGTNRPAGVDRVDFALLIERPDTGKPAGYATIQETEWGFAHVQFAGSFPETKSTLHTVRAFVAGLNWLSARYNYITCRVENTNRPMLKLAMAAGFNIIGVRTFDGHVLLDHCLRTPNAK